MKRLTTVILFFTMVVAAAQILLPKIVSDVVAQGLQRVTGSPQVTAKVDKSPAILMLSGEFDKVTAEATNVKIDKLTFRTMQIDLTGVAVDRAALFAKRTLALKRVDDAVITATINQEELAAFLNSSVKGIKNAVVTIESGKVEVTSALTLGGIARFDVKLEGRIVGDRENRRIKFVTDRFLLNNTPAGNITGSLLTEVTLLDLQKLPFGVNVRDIVTDQGQVIIYTDNRN